MKNKIIFFLIGLTVMGIILVMWNFKFHTASLPTDGMQRIQLNKLDIDNDQSISLQKALSLRKSNRSFSAKPISIDILSELLWAAFGINRKDSDGRTAPSAYNAKDITIFVLLPSGVYFFDASSFTLNPVFNKDIRSITGSNSIPPLELMYISDQSKWKNISKEEKNLFSAADAGFIGQNVYLYCASKGLATVIRGSINRNKLSSVLKLTSSQKVILVQSIGFPQTETKF
jgi:hypothetical protein